MITICLTHFKSLTLANLAASLYSVKQQDFTCVDSIVVVDNDSDDAAYDIQNLVDRMDFPVPCRLLSLKHGNPELTHSWSTNVAVRESDTPWVLFTRSDYILDFTLLERFVRIAGEKSARWNGFITGNVYHLNVSIEVCEQTGWRTAGADLLRALPGAEESYTVIDTGVWMARRDAFEQVGGLDESLSAWGHAQTHFQHKLHEIGVQFVRIPNPMFYHPKHSATRDITLAHQQLNAKGIDIHQLWNRYEGVKPY